MLWVPVGGLQWAERLFAKFAHRRSFAFSRPTSSFFFTVLRAALQLIKHRYAGQIVTKSSCQLYHVD